MDQDVFPTMRDDALAWVGLLALCAPYFAIILDAGVLNLAVPTIRHDLHASVPAAQWALSGYTLALAALLLAAGAAGDRFGHRRVLLVGVAAFGIASVCCAAAPDAASLIAARVAQGVGAAALLPATLALAPHLHPPGAARERATLVWLATGAVAMAAAPVAGGLLLAWAGWRPVFLVNVPIAVLTLALAGRHLPGRTRTGGRLDLGAQLLGALVMTAVAFAAIDSGRYGWWSAPVLVPAAAAAVLGAAAVARANRRRDPGPAGSGTVRTAVASAGIMGFCFYGVLLYLSVLLQDGRGWSPLRAGLALLPLTVASTAGPPLYRRLARRGGPRAVLLGGFCTVLLGALGLLAADRRYPALVVGMLLIGTASTVVFSALTTLLVAAAPPERIGRLSGWQNTSRQAGAMLATAVVGSIVLTSPTTHQLAATALLAATAAAGAAIATLEYRAAPTSRTR